MSNADEGHAAADEQEVREWREALEEVLDNVGPAQTLRILRALTGVARSRRMDWPGPEATPYVNSIRAEQQPPYPGDLALEQRLGSLMRWNALAMVVRANREHADLGGHIASYASAADLFEVGMNHFFRGHGHGDGGDLVFFQPHSAPGVYARAFLEGRLNERDLVHYRQETTAAGAGAQGLPSYPHPRLMPGFWQFPTGSMGIGPITSIYQARFMRYLEHRGLQPMRSRRVWGIFGDGEMDEPESLSALTLAAREGLDNLTWVINCNLQRLDGPVRGNGRIVDELERLFRGAGWHVIKLLWGSDWDALFARDGEDALVHALSETVDGQLQTFAARDGAWNREHFFGQTPALRALVQDMTDEQINRLTRGGHDPVKIHAAYEAALRHRGGPVVILAQTKKGFGMGAAGEGRMTTHQQKKLDAEALRTFRDRFGLPLSDEQAEALHFLRPPADSPEVRYLLERRRALGGFLPERRDEAEPVKVPSLEKHAGFAVAADGHSMSTTMAFVRQLSALMKEPRLGPRTVPIVADEARTFGMANLFRQFGIYSCVGQRYEPEDIGSILRYHEAREGQILEEGITEAGAMSSWVAAGTSYSTHGLAMLPFYVYYSMFGFQRVGDLIWAAADQRVRGFLMGATSGRTTLGGEGLQHQDGSSHLVASTIPSCRAYDPAFACELAVIIDHGMRQMLEHQCDVFYYVTLVNEKTAQPSLPEGVESDIIRGMYRFSTVRAGRRPRGRVQLLGSGALLYEVLAAAELLAADWGIESAVWSVTSYTELARDAREVARWNRLHPGSTPRKSHVRQRLAADRAVIAVSDYVQAVPGLISESVDAEYVTLGTDGFGRSDTRSALRRFFEVDRHHLVVAALDALHRQSGLGAGVCRKAIAAYGLGADDWPPWER